MRPIFRVTLVVVAVASLSACRQADGTVPTPSAERQAEIDDISRDIQNIASGRDPQAPEDLASDLRRYTEERRSTTGAVIELSRRAAAALAGREVNGQAAQQLAHHFWLAVSARELGDRQVESLQNDVQALLGTLGVPEEQAASVAAQIADVQEVATERTRRWYELF